MEPIEFVIPPVIKVITYAGAPEDAFDRFTHGIGAWWPLATHSLGGEEHAASVGFERLEVGGRLVELWRSGEMHVWGAIVDIHRPSRISFTWHVGREADAAQLIELSFAPNADGTTMVKLVHSGWERLGDAARDRRDSYNQGWDLVLARFSRSTPATTGQDTP
jgi:uncharacterized protein YndB with AHSA1/START domain